MAEKKAIPVTVLTGFLGSGKTTLMNRILKENHGKRIAVIENEFGEIGIDNDLVIDSEEEIFEMNNGCICCTVRGDLIRILGQLMKRRDKFDYIMIETTGLADPSPVVQTFFTDDELRESFALDGVITTVDAKHLWLHIDESHECKEQVAFADVLLINKIDLVSAEELQKVEVKIKSINPHAKIYKTKNAEIDINHIIHIKAFDLEKIGKEQDEHHHKEHCHDEHCTHEHHHHDHDHKHEHEDHSHCDHDHGHCEHDHKEHHHHDHVHDETVKSVGLELDGEMDLKKLNTWISWLLQNRGADIFRMKGIFAVEGKEERFVFQGVHMLFDANSDRNWKEGEKRYNRVVFIGRNLDRKEIEEGVKMCLVPSKVNS